MSKLAILFNLKKTVSDAAYQEWANSIQVPHIRRNSAVSAYTIYRVRERYRDPAPPPYQYFAIVTFTNLADYEAVMSGASYAPLGRAFEEMTCDCVSVITDLVSIPV